MNTLSKKLELAANEQAILNALICMAGKFDVKDKTSLKKIIQSVHADSLNEYELRLYHVVKHAVLNNPQMAHMGNWVIGNQSKNMPRFDDPRGLNAFTFADLKANAVFVVIRGTASGEWLDNGYGLSGKMSGTPQQEQGREYFDAIVEKNNYLQKRSKIIISGHSKGGNKAQYVAFTSKYKDLIAQCFSFDGQGFAYEALKAFKEQMGEQAFHDLANKMYGFYAENDFVNPLGVPVVLEENRFYFVNANIKDKLRDFAKNHDVDGFLKGEDGSFTLQVEQGPVSKLVAGLSEELNAFPQEYRSVVAEAIMAVFQQRHGQGNAIDGSSVSDEKILEGLMMSAPLLITDLLVTQDGWDSLVGHLGPGVQAFRQNYGPASEWGVAVALDLILIQLVPWIIVGLTEKSMIEAFAPLLEKLPELKTLAGEPTARIRQAVQTWIQGFRQLQNVNLMGEAMEWKRLLLNALEGRVKSVLTPKEWSRTFFKAELAKKEDKEIAQWADEIDGVLAKIDARKNSIIRASRKGISLEEWFANAFFDESEQLFLAEGEEESAYDIRANLKEIGKGLANVGIHSAKLCPSLRDKASIKASMIHVDSPDGDGLVDAIMAADEREVKIVILSVIKVAMEEGSLELASKLKGIEFAQLITAMDIVISNIKAMYKIYSGALSLEEGNFEIKANFVAGVIGYWADAKEVALDQERIERILGRIGAVIIGVLGSVLGSGD